MFMKAISNYSATPYGINVRKNGYINALIKDLGSDTFGFAILSNDDGTLLSLFTLPLLTTALTANIYRHSFDVDSDNNILFALT